MQWRVSATILNTPRSVCIWSADTKVSKLSFWNYSRQCGKLQSFTDHTNCGQILIEPGLSNKRTYLGSTCRMCRLRSKVKAGTFWLIRDRPLPQGFGSDVWVASFPKHRSTDCLKIDHWFFFFLNMKTWDQRTTFFNFQWMLYTLT